MQASHPDLTRTFLVILIIALLISGSLWTLLPFLSALIRSTTIVVATWPLLERTQRLMGGRRRPAALLMTVVVAAVFVDAGNAFNKFGDPLEYSVGVGLRYRLPFLSVGLDVAQSISETDRSPRLHVNFTPEF